MTDRRILSLGAAAALGLGEWFSIANMGAGRRTADWLIAVLIGGPALAVLLGFAIAIPCALIAALRWSR